jgi:ABC-type multidrug transport system ATPase subunit
VLFEVLETGERAILYTTHILPEISRLADDLAFIDSGQIWLRTPKEDLNDRWRKISFRLVKESISFQSVVNHQRDGNNHQVISSDFESTLHQLQELGAENIQDFRMSTEEIAVQILKGGKGVASA